MREFEREILEKEAGDPDRQAVLYYALDSLFKNEGHFIGFKDFCRVFLNPIAHSIAKFSRQDAYKVKSDIEQDMKTSMSYEVSSP